jgi:23S rRNA (cytidine1920-2'-O)/16S rRNA (cytidine1409-2'-O)-methyltransferase
MEYVSRAGQKLEHALQTFGIEVQGLVCADLGSNIGGFVDCLLQHGAAKVYAIDTGYGVLDWKLRKDPRVVCMERTNAMHAQLPECVAVVTIDVAWTRQRVILPSARRLVRDDGNVISLIKPHYEADRALLREGILPDQHVQPTLEMVMQQIPSHEFAVRRIIASPIRGAGGNAEFLAWLTPVTAQAKT